MPDSLQATQVQDTAIPKGSIFGGSTFAQRREDIYKRLEQSADQCKLNYSGRKELATEKDETVAELCEALEDALSYGLIQSHSTVGVTAANLFANMQEIVTGASLKNGFSSNDFTFWDFCHIHLTPHERERYKKLKHVWTKGGMGRAFIRSTLNESSLARYILTWLSDEESLRRYYSPWSLLLDIEATKQLPRIVSGLDKILFALTVDTTELNAPMRLTSASGSTAKEEPVIFAPSPVPVTNTKQKRKGGTVVERPIATANSTEDLVNSLNQHATTKNRTSEHLRHFVEATEELAADVEEPFSFDPIEPELEFLKYPLPDFTPEAHTESQLSGSLENGPSPTDLEDRSDTSSQYSKSSSANCGANQSALEEKLREMSERCALLETRVAQLSRDNRQLVRRLTQHFHESGIDPSSSLATNFLITIPVVKLLKSKRGSSSYHAYEIHITMRQNLEHWFVLRRYREFYKLHKSLLRSHPSAASVDFPPKKHFGNMNSVFVEERRQQLQIYLLNLVEALPQVEGCKSKAELQKVFPFLRER